MGDKVSNRINENYYKQIADKITQLLDKIHNSSLSNKRWVWELMQNAKDVPNKFGRVSIKIDLWQDRLVFSHNGDNFTDADITGLIQQVSSKDSANEGEQKQTGKFGSGFITTHLLSSIVDICGVVLNPNTDKFQKFNLRLDRSARKSEDMIQSIKENLEWVKGLDKDDFDTFPIVEGYENRAEDSFDTSFTYTLNQDSFRSAQIGLKDLVNTLPITMVSLPEIKSVTVEDHVNGKRQHYVCNSEELFSENDVKIIRSFIKINDDVKYFLTYKKFNDGNPYLALSIETQILNGRYELMARDKSQPVLFRDFPLIGSEEFYFPYMLNGFEFEPTETRSGILLNSSQPKPQKNRAIIESAIQSVMSFNEWLLSQGAKNTYLMAASREPKPKEPWDETYAKPWIKGQMEFWHKELLKQKLLETEDGYVELSQIKIPDYGGKEANKKFYDILADFKVSGYLPLRTQQEEWAITLSWAKNIKTTKYDFFEDFQRVGNVFSLSKRLDKTEDDTYSWLNDLYRFIKEQGDVELLSKYPIVPNQYGDFCLLNKLVTDSAQRIPEELKNITTEILGRDLHDELLSEKIEDSIFGNTKEYKLDSLIQEINKKITVAISRNISITSKEWQTISEYVFSITSLFSPNNTDNGNKRKRMYDFIFHFVDGLSEMHSINDLPESLWIETDKFIIKYVPDLIVNSARNLSELGEKLLRFPNVHNEIECIDWINEYGYIADSYGISIPHSKNIYPNQNGCLKSLDELHYDCDIASQFKELNIVATKLDWKNILLDKRILSYESHSPRTTADIYNEISKTFNSSNLSDSLKMEIAKNAIILCSETQVKDHSDNFALYEIIRKLDKEIIEYQVIDNTNGFYWEIFAAYLLENLCKRIEKSENIKTLSEIIGEDEDVTVKYVNSVIEYTMIYYGKRYQKYVMSDYALWVNQKGEFCKLNDIRKDNNIDEEIKKLAFNPIINIDYRVSLLRKSMKCEYLVQQTTVTEDILTVIDRGLSDYVAKNNSLQKPEFANLVINLNLIVKRHPEYSTYLVFFKNHQDRLIVGSIGDENTLSLFGSIASSPEKLNLIKEINKLPIDDLKKIAKGQYVAITAEELAKSYGDIDPKDLPVMEIYEDDSISENDQRNYNDEAKKAVLQMLISDGFDTTNIKEEYSLINGVVKYDADKGDFIEFPLVVKSYKTPSYQFKLNPNEWYQLMHSNNSMLLIYRGDGVIEKVTMSDLFKNQDEMSLHFKLETLGSVENLSKFAEILKFFKGCKFDFSNLTSTRYESMKGYRLGQNNPNAFIDLTPDDKNLLN